MAYRSCPKGDGAAYADARRVMKGMVKRELVQRVFLVAGVAAGGKVGFWCRAATMAHAALLYT